MFETFYRLTGPPFKLSPDHRFFYGSAGHRKAMSYLRFGLHQGEGFIVITGNVGTGKSTLARQLLSELDPGEVIAAQLVTTQIDPDDALRMIVSEFGLRPPGSDKAAMLGAFGAFLEQQGRQGRRVLLLVDEAQNLPLRTLEEMRMLSNLLVDGRSVFQSFLLGQPQFNLLLADPQLEQLRQRIIASYHLLPMTPGETREYIEHRLRLAGWANDPAVTHDAYARIHAETEGVPRLINALCSRLLLYGAIQEVHTLDGAAVEEVAADQHRELSEGIEVATAQLTAQGRAARAARRAPRDNDEAAPGNGAGGNGRADLAAAEHAPGAGAAGDDTGEAAGGHAGPTNGAGAPALVEMAARLSELEARTGQHDHVLREILETVVRLLETAQGDEARGDTARGDERTDE